VCFAALSVSAGCVETRANEGTVTAPDVDAQLETEQPPTPLPDGPTGVVASYTQGPPTAACPTFAVTWATPQPAEFTALAAAPDGGLALAGSIGGAAWVVRVDAKGQPLWQKVVGKGMVNDIASMPGGGWAVVGAWPTSEGGFTARLDDNGALLWLKPWPFGGGPRKVLALPDGTLAAAVTTPDPGYGSVGLLRLDAVGSQLSLVTTDGWNSVVHSLVQLPGGVIAMTVTDKAGAGLNSGSLWKLDAAGQPLSLNSFATVAMLGVTQDGTLLAGCNTFASGAGIFATYVVRSDGPAVTWKTWVTTLGANFMAFWDTSAFAAFANGDSVVASFHEQGRWSLVRADGQFAWQRPAYSTRALLVLADGALLGVGHTGDPQNPLPVLFRADRWGHIACEQTAACASVPLVACNDGNGCTSDLCIAPGVCTHTALDDYVPCGQDPTQSVWDVRQFCIGGVCTAM
jgi:hypothetical protein